MGRFGARFEASQAGRYPGCFTNDVPWRVEVKHGDDW